jgi:hypothetical protein
MVKARLDEPRQGGIGILGLEGFIIGEATYPAMARIVDFSRGAAYRTATS